MAASVLEDMTKSVALLSGLPDQESRLHTLQQYKTELENQLSPKLDSCLQINSDDQLLSLYKIYCSLHIEQSFVQKYCTYHASSFKEYIIQISGNFLEFGPCLKLNLLSILFKTSIQTFIQHSLH